MGRPDRIIKTSKFLSFVLRHRPQSIGLELDGAGWAPVAELIRLANEAGRDLTPELIRKVVAENDKQRFSLSEDGSRIRANQGHSVVVELGLEPTRPPDELFHGTARRFLPSILEHGLRKGSRQHVHLSVDVATAVRVGQRHGPPVVLRVDAGAMFAAGEMFFLAANGVWLCHHVAPRFLGVVSENG